MALRARASTLAPELRAGRRLRWLAVAVGTVLVVSAPAVVTRASELVRESAGAGAVAVEPRQLLARVLASSTVPHQGVAESRGALGLPDLEELGDVAALLGGTTRTRVWWARPAVWRVDRLTATGEQGTYAAGGGIGRAVVTWDYERNRRVTVLGEPAARLPRPDDLLPPQLARRLLGDVAPSDRLSALPDRWVAGHPATGLRVEPGDTRSTVGAVEVWADGATGLPLQVRVTTRAGGEAVTAQWLELDLTAPDPDLLRPPAPPTARRAVTTAADLVAQVDSYQRYRLPGTLAGSRASRALVGSTGTYGRGLARFVVLALPYGTGRDLLDGARGLAPPRRLPAPAPGGGADTGADADEQGLGDAVTVRSGVLSAVVVTSDDGGQAFALAGLVEPAVLDAAATELLRSPPQRVAP